MRRTEWHVDPRGRANLFRYREEREGLKRGMKMQPELGAVEVNPEMHVSVEVSCGRDE